MLFVLVRYMRKTILGIALLLGSLALQVQGQVSVSFNINTQPVWGPVGYDQADYYYMPDIQTYYSVSQRQYYYNSGGRWVGSPDLPPQYKGYDVYHGYKAVINEPTPWMHDDRYRKQYAQYKGRHDQQIIRDSHDQKYYANPGHPEHANWQKQHGNDNGRSNDHDNGHRGDGHEDHGHEDHGRDH